MTRLVLDTSLLVLFVVGGINAKYIERHKRLSGYEPRDYDLLLSVLESYSDISVCPNVMTEASNILRQAPGFYRQLFTEGLAAFSMQTSERYVPTRNAISQEAYLRLGVTDAVLLTMVEGDEVLLTDDIALFIEAVNRGLKAEKFSYIRERAYGL